MILPRSFIPIVSSEHASRDVPSLLKSLGVPEEALASHAAWDPGAREVATQLAEAIEAPLFLGRYTRLFVDLNRSPDSPEVVPVRAFGIDVPGNAALDEAKRRERVESHHLPYWQSVEHAIHRGIASAEGGGGGAVLHVSVHSFVEELSGRRRSLDLGLLFDPDHALESAVCFHLKGALSEGAFDTRFNEPYDGRSDGLTTACRRLFPCDRYAGIEIEISQRLLPELDRVARALILAIEPLVKAPR